jgi:predicted house-cleaning noncanonical NTP pyrophosphatase (MazG superfamily)
MKLPLSVAEKLLLLVSGEKMPASKLKNEIITDMISEGIIHKPGKRKSTVQLADKQQLKLYLENRFAIKDLHTYIETCKRDDLIRADLVSAAADSKVRAVRTFKGFLVNCYNPILATLNRQSITISPTTGTFNFIYDFEGFIPEEDITIVGIENPENFRHIDRQKYLFQNIKPLFVSRYPQNQSKDLIKWLQSIQNNYLHFGDFDLSGIGIYLNEFKKYLNNKAKFFTPDNIDEMIKNSGSKKRYDEQKVNFEATKITENNLLQLIDSIHKHKKGLDQEIFINS